MAYEGKGEPDELHWNKVNFRTPLSVFYKGAAKPRRLRCFKQQPDKRDRPKKKVKPMTLEELERQIAILTEGLAKYGL